MANIKVSELPTATVFNDSDLAMIVQNGENKKITKENMLDQIGAYAKGTMSSDYVVSTANQNITLPIDSFFEKTGNLTLSDNGIRIGKNIHTVLVSGNIYFYSGFQYPSRSVGYLLKNDILLAVVNFNLADTYLHLCLPTVTVSVDEGDVIYLKVQSTTTGGTIKNYHSGTFLNVAVLN